MMVRFSSPPEKLSRFTLPGFTTQSGSTAPWAINPLWNLKTSSINIKIAHSPNAPSTFSKKDQLVSLYRFYTSPTWRIWLRHRMRLAISLTLAEGGSSMAARIATMANTTSSSIKAKPSWPFAFIALVLGAEFSVCTKLLAEGIPPAACQTLSSRQITVSADKKHFRVGWGMSPERRGYPARSPSHWDYPGWNSSGECSWCRPN